MHELQRHHSPSCRSNSCSASRWDGVWPDRHRLHHGLRRAVHDQLRPWRRVHDRCLCRLGAAGRAVHLSRRADASALRAAAAACRGDGGHRRARSAAGAARLPPALSARRDAPRTADQRGRRFDLSAERGHADRGRAREGLHDLLRYSRAPGASLSPASASRSWSSSSPRSRGDDGRSPLPGAANLAWPLDPCGGRGSRDGGSHGHRCLARRRADVLHRVGSRRRCRRADRFYYTQVNFYMG